MSLLIEKYTYEKYSRTSVDGERRYKTPTGPLPSVTTILDKMKSAEKREALANWKKRVGSAEAQRITTESANIGTVIHAMIESYILGEDYSPGGNLIFKRAYPLAQVVIDKGLSNVSEVWGSEVPLYYPGLYAGTTDCVGIWKGEPAIIDFKTTKKPKRRDWIDDYFLQGSAYAMAHNEIYNTDIKRTVIMMIVWDGDRAGEYQEFVVEGEEFDNYSSDWAAKVEAYYDKYN